MPSSKEPIFHAKNRSIPSLDGLRALSVLVVILGHSESILLDRIPFNIVFRSGGQGVAVFFVISGFLITHLLLKELERTGGINLKKFYFRRTFRIFPPFYFFLLVVILLALFKVVPVDRHSLVAAFTYTYNYVPYSGAWVLHHCWSLAVEEQFYLLWPLCMAIFSKRTCLRIAGGVILLSPLIRLATHYMWPSMRGNIDYMTHTRLDTIMTGCLLALAVEMKLWQRFALWVMNPFLVALAVLAMTIDAEAAFHLRGVYIRSIGYTLQEAAIAIIILYVVFRHESWLGRLLNNRVLQHFGMISYSLYLWQQLFCGPYTQRFPLNVILIVLCAEASYFLIEKPSLKLRDKIQRKMSAQTVYVSG
jgi:peptidoglycan/LPS O-acetylase OafA/YrhL